MVHCTLIKWKWEQVRNETVLLWIQVNTQSVTTPEQSTWTTTTTTFVIKILYFFLSRMALWPKKAKWAATWAIISTRLRTSCFLIELLPNITSTILCLWSTVSQFSLGYIYAHSCHIWAQFAIRIFHVNLAEGALGKKHCYHKLTSLSPSCSPFLVQLLQDLV